MEEIKNFKNSALKKALERRERGSLPSNFSHRMMQDIYRADEKRRKRALRLNYIVLGVVIAGILACSTFFILNYTDFTLLQLTQPFKEAFQWNDNWGFYLYVTVLAIVLLIIDNSIRKWYFGKHND